MENTWDIRYSGKNFIYGKTPNVFFKSNIDELPKGKVLLPAEGEGRNAVYAAKQGWDVHAFDSSKVAKDKALSLAAENNVKIDYSINSFEDYLLKEDFFDVVGLFYAHQKSHFEFHQKLIKGLKKNGLIILEAFTKQQLQYSSGGPKDEQMLYSVEELQKDFVGLSDLQIWEEEIMLSEGDGHKGKASVVRVIGRK